MARKKREEQKTTGEQTPTEEQEITEIEPPLKSLSPIYTNFTMVFPASDAVIIDFALIAPSYSKPYDIRDYHVSRLCLPWDAIQSLSKDLQEAIEDHKKEVEAKKEQIQVVNGESLS